MSITIKAYANADDVLIAWQPDTWSNDWVGFQLERRNDITQQVSVLVNRIPPKPTEGPVQAIGISSTQSPIRRCLWTDHGVVATDNVSYRVTPMKGPEKARSLWIPRRRRDGPSRWSQSATQAVALSVISTAAR